MVAVKGAVPGILTGLSLEDNTEEAVLVISRVMGEMCLEARVIFPISLICFLVVWVALHLRGLEDLVRPKDRI